MKNAWERHLETQKKEKPLAPCLLPDAHLTSWKPILPDPGVLPLGNLPMPPGQSRSGSGWKPLTAPDLCLVRTCSALAGLEGPLPVATIPHQGSG